LLSSIFFTAGGSASPYTWASDDLAIRRDQPHGGNRVNAKLLERRLRREDAGVPLRPWQLAILQKPRRLLHAIVEADADHHDARVIG